MFSFDFNGDWGLGIGPIPNPQSPIPKNLNHFGLFCGNNLILIYN